MKIQNDLIVPYHDPTMEEQSITDILLDFNIDSPSLNFDDFLEPTSDINSTVNNAVVVNSGGNDNVSGEFEDIPIPDDFVHNFLNDPGNGEGYLSEEFGGGEILPIGDDFENSNRLLPRPDNPCAECFVLREIVHTNGFRVMKLEIHGEIGIISHAILHMCDEGGAEMAQNHEFHIYDFSTESILAVKKFLTHYYEVRKFEGYSLISDALAHFYDALSVGINYFQENSYMFSQPASMTSVNETMFGSKQNSVLSPIIGDAMVSYNIPANTDIGDSSLQSGEKGKGKKRTKFAEQRERTAEMKLKDFADLFDLPINAAAKAMRVCTTVVKKKCRDGGVGRWPYRKIKGLKTKISKKKLALEAARNSEDRRKFLKQLQKLEGNLSSLYQELRNSGISDSLSNMEN